MQTINRLIHPLSALRLGLAFALAGLTCTTPSQAQIEPAARALAQSVEAKIGAAKTIQLVARHKLDPAFSIGSNLEKSTIHLTVERPNRFHAIQPAGRETREIAYDGSTFIMMHPQLKHHAVEDLPARSISEFADQVSARFGFRPPIAELLASDFSAQIFRDVTSATVMAREKIGFTTCDRLHFVQPGMTGDLWVAVKDGLPRRYRLTFTDLAGQPTREVDLKQWKLNGPVNPGLFAKRPANDSIKIQMFKSR